MAGTNGLGDLCSSNFRPGRKTQGSWPCFDQHLWNCMPDCKWFNSNACNSATHLLFVVSCARAGSGDGRPVRPREARLLPCTACPPVVYCARVTESQARRSTRSPRGRGTVLLLMPLLLPMYCLSGVLGIFDNLTSDLISSNSSYHCGWFFLCICHV